MLWSAFNGLQQICRKSVANTSGGGFGDVFGGPEGGLSDSRGSGKPLLLLRFQKAPSGPPKPSPDNFL